MKRLSLILLSIMILSSLFSLRFTVNAKNGVPYQTYTLGTNGRIIPTQTAFLPVGVMGKEYGLNAPQDIFYFNKEFYIADTNNKRVLIIGEDAKEVKFDEFITPMGVFANEEYLFVADKGAKTVFQIKKATNEIILRITKPTSPIYGQKNDFLPIKVAVGSNDSIYIVGEGSTSGIIQVNYAGEFIGYLGINTVPLSLRKKIYNFFVKGSNVASSIPASPTNVALGQKGSILTTNINVQETFKRLNISGVNTLLEDTFYPQVTFTDITMNFENFIYLVSSEGYVFEYDASGRLLFTFDTKDTQMTQMLGLTSQPTGIATDDVGNLYILDKGNNSIYVYQRTVFVDLVHQAVTLFNDGKYLESKPLWEEINRQNTSFAFAHTALGMALTKEGDFESALQEFYDAKDYQGYSMAYWEIRNIAIQKNLTTWVIILIASLILLKLSYSLFKSTKIYDKYLALKETLHQKKWIGELALSTRMLRHPADVCYLIKRKNKASYRSGFVVLFLFLLVYLVNSYGQGFLFRTQENASNLILQILIVIGIIFLYVVVNYLISTLSDGEGRFKDIFIATSYSLMPIIIFTLPMTLISHVLTYNESFIYSFYHQIITGWTILLLILSIKNIHNYSVWETIKSILIILFGMLIVVIIGLLIYTFMGQLIDFIISIIKEVVYRV
jgi:tetratricopeptide (TPR) repeat protein